MSTEHWAKQQERGNPFFLTVTRWIVTYLPLWVIKGCTLVVVSYFYLTSQKARANIHRYQQRLQATFPRIALPKYAVFRTFLAFGEAITDRFQVWQKRMQFSDLIIDDQDNIFHEIETSARGQIFVCSHFGNIEVCRAMVNSGQHRANYKLNVLVHSKNAEAFNKALEDAGADPLSLIQVEDLDAQKMLELSNCIERGEWIAIAADRVPIRGDKTACVNFLGETAEFPQGAWFLASILKAPLNTIYSVKEKGKYRLILRKFSPPIHGRGKVREQNIQQMMQKYADELAQECAKNPLQWFNFYDFWNDNAKSLKV